MTSKQVFLMVAFSILFKIPGTQQDGRCGVVSNNILTSPGYPNNYPDEMDCTYSVYIPHGMAMRITFHYFFLTSASSCIHDYLSIKNEIDQTFGKYCGPQNGRTVIVTGRFVNISFHSDMYDSYGGYNLSFSALCANHSCQNGETCVAGVNNYTCSCVPGYTGSNCSDIDYCFKQPCQNDGTCTNSVNSYTCSCVPGYTGSNCSDIDYCFQQPCQNGGTCTNNVNNYTCSCVSGYFGSNCSDVDYCFQQPCQNGGTCTNGVSSYTCSCVVDYTGVNCSVGGEEETPSEKRDKDKVADTIIALLTAGIVLIALTVIAVVAILIFICRHRDD